MIIVCFAIVIPYAVVPAMEFRDNPELQKNVTFQKLVHKWSSFY